MTLPRGFDSIVAKCAFALLAGIVLISLLAPWIAPYNPNQIDMRHRLAPVSGEHLLGTDTLGRDLLSRVVYGGRVSILLSMLATAVTMLIGLIVGTLAGYYGGRIDDLVFLITNLFQGLPSMSLMVALAGILGPGVGSLLLALVITAWPGFSRIVRGEVLKIREKEYIEGIRAIGGGNLYIIVHYILPNMLGPLVVIFTIRISRGILSIASLSFLGLGLQPPTPDWGVMIRDAIMYFRGHPLLIIAPGIAIFATSLSINLLGDALRDYFDVRIKQ